MSFITESHIKIFTKYDKFTSHHISPFQTTKGNLLHPVSYLSFDEAFDQTVPQQGLLAHGTPQDLERSALRRALRSGRGNQLGTSVLGTSTTGLQTAGLERQRRSRLS